MKPSHPPELTSFIHNHPKIELHAHISGSIRESTLCELIQKQWPDQYHEKFKICRLIPGQQDQRTLDECFALFKVLHDIISSPTILRRITLEVLEDFVIGNFCCYIELRSTPRSFTVINGETVEIIPKEQYIQCILETLYEFQQLVLYLCRANHLPTSIPNSTVIDAPYSDISQFSLEAQSIIEKYSSLAHPDKHYHVGGYDLTRTQVLQRIQSFVSCGILFSIDRSQGLHSAEDTLNILKQYLPRNNTDILTSHLSTVFAGLDLSGNPFSKLKFDQLEPIFQNARMDGMKISIHFAETDDYRESRHILHFKPDRLGHAAVLDHELYHTILQHNIPVEVCITSNIACKLHSGVLSHPLIGFIQHALPVVLCTDDAGVFSCTLNGEWEYLLNLPHFNNDLIEESSNGKPLDCGCFLTMDGHRITGTISTATPLFPSSQSTNPQDNVSNDRYYLNKLNINQFAQNGVSSIFLPYHSHVLTIMKAFFPTPTLSE